MSKKVKIVFILPSLVAGGAERVMSFIATSLNKNHFDVSLLVIGHEKDTTYNVDSIGVTYLNQNRVLYGTFKVFQHVLKTKPNIVVSCMSHVNVMSACILKFFPKIKLAIREANMKKVSEVFSPNNSFLHGDFMLKLSHKRADAIICQSEDMAKELMDDYGVHETKIVVINNPIADEFHLVPHDKKSNSAFYITVGRLHQEKGYERILKVLSKLDFPFTYTIIGSGKQFESINNTAKSLGIHHKIRFIEHTSDVMHYLADSHVYLQGSYAEGFPNALMESCAVGTPVVAFESPGGTREIIEPGINGFIASTEEEFRDILVQIQEHNPFDSKEVSDSVFQKFSKYLIIKKYENLFFNLINNEP